MLLTFNTKTQPSSHFQDFTDFILYLYLYHPNFAPRQMEGTTVNWYQLLEGHEAELCFSSLSDLIFFQLSSVTFPFLSITQWTGTKIWEVLGQSKILLYVKLYFCSPRTPSLKRPWTSPIYVRWERFYYLFCVCVFLNNPIVVTNVSPFF